MNRLDLPRIAALGDKAHRELDKHGLSVWAATYDWQSPLRSGGAKGSKGDHADPTAASVIAPDPLALLHDEYRALLRAKERADAMLLAFFQHVLPIDPDQIDRSRRNQIPACIVCTGPAVPARRGMCDACRKAWERDGSTDLEGFKRRRQRRLDEESRPLHEHEVV